MTWLAKPGQLWLLALRQAARPSDQMRQAGVAAMDPVLVHCRALADSHPRPVRDQRLERGLTPARLHREPRYRRLDHHPQPRQHPVRRPAGLVHVVDLCPPGLHRHGLVMGFEGLRDPIHHVGP
jgi:hypothetical protein